MEIEAAQMTSRKKRVIFTIVGARPQFIKAAPLGRAIRAHRAEHGPPIIERLIHTGQHFDYEMSTKIFRELKIAEPYHHMGINGGSHGEMTGRILDALNELFAKEKPTGVLVYGDTNSTLAGALAARNYNLPLAHVEAGLRSHNLLMPEEVNRVTIDIISNLLFCPTRQAVRQLKSDSIRKGVFFTGDVMLDQSEQFRVPDPRRVKALKLPERFGLVTIHRPQNTDIPEHLLGIAEGLLRINRKLPLLLPLHPRTEQALQAIGALEELKQHLRVSRPLGYIELQTALNCSSLLITDSGGLQKEAYFAAKPCVTIRTETEWTETLEDGANRLCGPTPLAIVRAVNRALAIRVRPRKQYGDGHAAEKIISILDREWTKP